MRNSRGRRLFSFLGPRGAGAIEYALLIIGVMLLAAGGYKMLGSTVKKKTDNSSTELDKGGEQGGGASGANGESEAYDIGHSGGGSEADLIDKEVKFKRSLGIAFLAAGLLAIGYVVAKARNTKKEADLQGPQGPEV